MFTVPFTLQVESGYRDSESKISQFKAGTLPLQPGCDEEQSLESELNGVLGRVRDEVGQMAVKRLSMDNAPRVMSGMMHIQKT